MVKAPETVGRPSDVVEPGALPAEAAAPRGKANVVAAYPVVHHVMWTISKDGSRSGGSKTLDELEEYLLTYFRQGWELLKVEFMEKVPEGFTFCWILIKRP